jgi:hypothetical protein
MVSPPEWYKVCNSPNNKRASSKTEKARDNHDHFPRQAILQPLRAACCLWNVCSLMIIALKSRNVNSLAKVYTKKLPQAGKNPAYGYFIQLTKAPPCQFTIDNLRLTIDN